MAHSKEELWNLVDPVVQSAGLVLFDIEVPGRDGGVFRVFIDRNSDASGKSSGEEDNGRIGIQECVAVSHGLSALEGFDDLFDGAWTLEVSSPGMNRRLTRVEHFHGALGEQVRVKGRLEDGSIRTVTGRLREVSPAGAIIVESEDDEASATSTFPIRDIIEARVEFSFGKKKKSKKKS